MQKKNTQTRESRKKERRRIADMNQEVYEALTTQQKLDRLDQWLGKGVGAKKQRAKLLEQLASER